MAQKKYTDGSGVSEIWLNIKNYVYSQLLGKSDVGHTHTKSEITDFPTLSTVATSGSYNDLSNKPTIPTVNNATLTIQKNGSTVKTFTANASSNVTANITVPTKTSELTNDSHVSITTETDTTSTGTPAHGGTFTCIDSVTRDSNGHVTKVNTKTVTLPSDRNTDTLVTQNVSTANENHPILLSVTKDATTNQGAKTSIFASSVKVNPSTGTVTATAFSGNLTGNVTGNVSGSSGSCTGNSATATNATNNTNGKELTNTIIKGLSISGKTITYTQIDGTTGTLTTQDSNTWTAMKGATSSANGSVGYVNAVPPKDGYNTKYLRADGTWQVPPDHTYTVNNATLTIQKNGTNVATFTSNASSNVTCNITVPTKTSDLTNDSGFITSDNTKIPLAGSNQISGSLIPATDNSIDIGSSTKNLKMLYTKGITIDGKTVDTDANDNMTFNGHIVDTIEEQGNGYIRYSNGIQICWGSVTWQSKISNLWGAIYESDHASEAYAKSFIETPCVSACNVGSSPFSMIESSGGNGTTTPMFFLCRGAPMDAISNCIVDYIAIGRWK